MAVKSGRSGSAQIASGDGNAEEQEGEAEARRGTALLRGYAQEHEQPAEDGDNDAHDEANAGRGFFSGSGRSRMARTMFRLLTRQEAKTTVTKVSTMPRE